MWIHLKGSLIETEKELDVIFFSEAGTEVRRGWGLHSIMSVNRKSSKGSVHRMGRSLYYQTHVYTDGIKKTNNVLIC